MKHQKTNPYLAKVYRLNPKIEYQIEEDRVLIIKRQNHWIQRFFRKLSVRIPEMTTIKLDDYGSQLFQAIDGKLTIEELGQILVGSHQEAGIHLYERLELYLHYLETEEKWIEPV